MIEGIAHDGDVLVILGEWRPCPRKSSGSGSSARTLHPRDLEPAAEVLGLQHIAVEAAVQQYVIDLRDALLDLQAKIWMTTQFSRSLKWKSMR